MDLDGELWHIGFLLFDADRERLLRLVEKHNEAMRSRGERTITEREWVAGSIRRWIEEEEARENDH